jgi:hypothetical protein
MDPRSTVRAVGTFVNRSNLSPQHIIALRARRRCTLQPRIVPALETSSTRHIVAIGNMAW